jgi:hypothetical protein
MFEGWNPVAVTTFKIVTFIVIVAFAYYRVKDGLRDWLPSKQKKGG